MYVMTPYSAHNLNGSLRSAPARSKRTAGRTAAPIRSSSPPVRIIGSATAYRGGYRIDV
jgi:hypothetical protein